MRPLFQSLALIVALASSSAVAGEALLLKADSSNAMGVTGDLKFSREKVVFSTGAVMTIKQVDRDVYRVLTQPDRPLKEGGTLCGRPVFYITLHRDPNGLVLLNATWDDVQPSPPTPEMFAIDNTCAVYGYIVTGKTRD